MVHLEEGREGEGRRRGGNEGVRRGHNFMKGNSDRNSAKKQKASPRRIDGSKKHRNGRRPARNDSPDTRGTNGKSGISKTRSRRRKPGRGSASEENRSANTCPAELTEGLLQWTCRECTPSETLSAPLTTLSTGAVTGRVTGRKQKARDGSVENQGGGEGVDGGRCSERELACFRLKK